MIQFQRKEGCGEGTNWKAREMSFTGGWVEKFDLAIKYLDGWDLFQITRDHSPQFSHRLIIFET